MQAEECSVCHKTMMPIACSTNPEASEWYCEKCHKSKPMDSEMAAYCIAAERGRKK
jgi:hypothetical protein